MELYRPRGNRQTQTCPASTPISGIFDPVKDLENPRKFRLRNTGSPIGNSNSGERIGSFNLNLDSRIGTTEEHSITDDIVDRRPQMFFVTEHTDLTGLGPIEMQPGAGIFKSRIRDDFFTQPNQIHRLLFQLTLVKTGEFQESRDQIVEA